ncbi:MAG: anti-sigma factor [Pseudomonadales bacterium]|nr:anti-sigma factor [Pseudomonadales bacterium]
MMTESENLALEYVLGTLREQERAQFIARLRTEPELMNQVSFWEEQLMNFHQGTQPIDPAEQTWKAIESRLNGPAEEPPTWLQRFFANSWQWFASSALTLVICLGIWFTTTQPVAPTDPTSYVAVMTSEGGGAVLTALAPKGNDSLWLKWEGTLDVDAEADLQLWAISRSDAQTRSLAVLDNTGENRVKIGKAEWGLIKDAEYLILTREKTGGAAQSTPSEFIIAKGLCIQFNPDLKQG